MDLKSISCGISSSERVSPSECALRRDLTLRGRALLCVAESCRLMACRSVKYWRAFSRFLDVPVVVEVEVEGPPLPPPLLVLLPPLRFLSFENLARVEARIPFLRRSPPLEPGLEEEEPPEEPQMARACFRSRRTNLWGERKRGDILEQWF